MLLLEGNLATAILHTTLTTLTSVITAYGYLGIFVLMLLESMAFPIPSEVVLPAVGYFAYNGTLNVFVAFAVVLMANVLGLAIDYYVAYYFGKEVVYKHLGFFRIKKESLDSMDAWFARNGAFTVFITRFIPLVRGLINFPAGFAKMPQRKYFAYSLLGCVIWDAILISFGYYAFGAAQNAYIALVAMAVFAIALYVIYAAFVKRMRKGTTSRPS